MRHLKLKVEPQNTSRAQKLSPLIEAGALKTILGSNALVIIDARQGADAYDHYLHKHIAGALWMDLEKDLATPLNPENGGRHPLPSVTEFTATLGSLGITPQSRIIIYDEQSGAMASARLWWMLRAIGHEQVQVLNGGLKAAEKMSLPLRGGVENSNPAPPYPISEWQLPLADFEEVQGLSESGKGLIVDVRSPARYAGKAEPIDPVAGHIPGSVNIPFQENLDQNGRYLNPDVLRENYLSSLTGHVPEDQVFHCGSGVTACHSLLALDYAGLPLPKLYIGSWSEWCRRVEG